MPNSKTISQIAGIEPPFLNQNTIYNQQALVNGGLDLTNFNGQQASITAPGANVEFAVPHTLRGDRGNRIPIGFWILWRSAAGVLYQGPTTGTPWTLTNMYLKSSVAAVVYQIYLF